MTETASAVTKAAEVATYGGSGTAIYFGFSPGEWQVIGIVGGLVVGVLGLAINACVTWHFKAQHLKLAQLKAKADPEE